MKDYLLDKMRAGDALSARDQVILVILLSIPAILAQIASITMQYIDASMVGRLGADASAAIGLVISTTWLTGSLCQAAGVGFTVKVAYHIGGGQKEKARRTVKYGLVASLAISLFIMAIVLALHRSLPIWLGGSAQIIGNASAYFLIYGFSLPFLTMNYTAGGMLQCSGDMRTPGMLNILMCILDVIFNFFLIFPGRRVEILGQNIFIPGADLKVYGAAMGTALSALVCGLLMLWKLLAVSEDLPLRKGEKWEFPRNEICEDLRVSVPVMVSSLIMGLAYVAGTYIVAPLGTIAIAANSFAVTAESICYMPGYGIGAASTTIVGQAKGAGRERLMRRFGYLCVALGALAMGIMAVFMFLMAPLMMAWLTPDLQVRAAGTAVLRLIVFAEPLFGVSIVAEGVFRGLGRTGIPSILILVSMWLVRIPLAAFLAGSMGLTGVWLAQGLELCFRGAVFLLALVMVNRNVSILRRPI